MRVKRVLCVEITRASSNQLIFNLIFILSRSSFDFYALLSRKVVRIEKLSNRVCLVYVTYPQEESTKKLMTVR